MAINAKNDGFKKELIPAGSYVARCYSMIHLGTRLENIKGVDKIMNKVCITWELPTELKVFKEEKGEQPHAISKDYTLSMNEKSNLRKDLESWRGKNFTEEQAESFDITKLLGIPCMLNIIHHTSKNGNTYEKISNISGIPKGMTCPPQINENFEFNFEDQFDRLIDLPEYFQDKIKESNEYKRIMNPETTDTKSDEDWTDPTTDTSDDDYDDLPF